MAQEWIQLPMILQLFLIKMKLEKKHWEQCILDNENLILQSMMTIEMAKKIIILADEKIAEFPKEEKK